MICFSLKSNSLALKLIYAPEVNNIKARVKIGIVNIQWKSEGTNAKQILPKFQQQMFLIIRCLEEVNILVTIQ